MKFFDVPQKKFIVPSTPRKNEILLNSFRLDFSPLNEDRSRHGYDVSPRCLCDRNTETQKHFFLSCDRYTNERTQLVHEINQQLRTGSDFNKLNQTSKMKLLLFAESKLLKNPADQAAIYDSVLNYIKKSKRIEVN